jgi:very-short-patch-repair endonuclease
MSTLLILFAQKLRLIVEVDGYSHRFKPKEDKERDEKLEKLEYAKVRFSETEVINDLENVIRVLESYLPDG